MFTFLLFYSRRLMKTSYGAQLPHLFSPFPFLPPLSFFSFPLSLLSLIPTSFPSLRVWGSAQAPLEGSSRTRPPNDNFCASRS